MARFFKMRFSLKILMGVLTAAAIGLAVFGTCLRRADRQSRAIALMESHEISFSYYYPPEASDPPVWLEDLLGCDFFFDVEHVSVRLEPEESPEDRASVLTSLCNNISNLRNLQAVTLSFTNLNLKEMQEIESCRSLEDLDNICVSYSEPISKESLKGLSHLHNLNVTALQLVGDEAGDCALRHLDHWPNMRVLTLLETDISDTGLEMISKSPHLQRLHILVKGRPITDVGIKHLSAMPDLELLVLANARIKGDCWQAFSGHLGLRELHLYACDLDDEALAFLPAIPNLRELRLAGNKRLTEKSAQHLTRLPKLEVLGLRDTGIQGESLDRVKAVLPQLDIE